ncbi:hypothetical protein ABK040_004276 [Willaertia magna]
MLEIQLINPTTCSVNFTSRNECNSTTTTTSNSTFETISFQLFALNQNIWKIKLTDQQNPTLRLPSFAIDNELELEQDALALEIIPTTETSTIIENKNVIIENNNPLTVTNKKIEYLIQTVAPNLSITFLQLIFIKNDKLLKEEKDSFSLSINIIQKSTLKIITKNISFTNCKENEFQYLSTVLQKNTDENNIEQVIDYVTKLNENCKEIFKTTISFDKLNVSENFNENLEEKFKVYGLGEKSGKLNKNGKFYTMWNYDNFAYHCDSDPLYQSQPLIYCINQNVTTVNTSNSDNQQKEMIGYGIFIDSVTKQDWNLQNKNNCNISIERNGDLSIYFFFEENKIINLLQNITKLSGTSQLPPLYTLGFQQSRYSYYPESKVREISNGFIQNDIPCDVFYLDIDYMKDFKCFTFNENYFPNVEKLTCDLLQKNRQRIVCIIDPGISVDDDYHNNNQIDKKDGYDVYHEGEEINVWCELNGKKFIDTVWPERAVFPDYFNLNVRKWWGRYYSKLLNVGVQGFWNDMNEPATFTQHYAKTFNPRVLHKVRDINNKELLIEHRYLHNAYGQMMAKASQEGLDQLLQSSNNNTNQNKKKIRTFLLSRSGYIGIQKYAYTWTGDNTSNFEHLAMSIPMLLNMTLCGQQIIGADVGGFINDCNEELYTRWIALGAFCYPFFRSHTMTGTIEQNCWSFGEKCLQNCREFIKLRYQLIPYIYTHIYRACNDHIPFLRPLWMDFTNDINCFKEEWENTQYLFGPNLLIAPILEKNKEKRQVYLPKFKQTVNVNGNNKQVGDNKEEEEVEGYWIDFFNKEKKYLGGQVIEFNNVTLDRIIILVKSNSIIPIRKESKQSVYDNLQVPIEYKVFTTVNKKMTFEGEDNVLYLDDGLTLDFKEKNDFGFYQLKWNGEFVEKKLLRGSGYKEVLTVEEINENYFDIKNSDSSCNLM